MMGTSTNGGPVLLQEKRQPLTSASPQTQKWQMRQGIKQTAQGVSSRWADRLDACWRLPPHLAAAAAGT